MKPAVVMVHGLYLHAIYMRLWQTHLRNAGYDVYGFNYASVKGTLLSSARELADFVARLENRQVHCVGHSLGGLLIMQMLQHFPDSRVKRVVLVGSPYQPAHVPTTLTRSRVGRFIMGQVMVAWTRQAPLIPPGRLEIGVIAGDRPIGLGRLVAPGIPSPHDGTVAVIETAVPGMVDRIILPVTHTQMLFSRQVMKQIAAFFRRGKFEHKS